MVFPPLFTIAPPSVCALALVMFTFSMLNCPSILENTAPKSALTLLNVESLIVKVLDVPLLNIVPPYKSSSVPDAVVFALVTFKFSMDTVPPRFAIAPPYSEAVILVMLIFLISNVPLLRFTITPPSLVAVALLILTFSTVNIP